MTLKNGRLDVYAMISTGTLQGLRVNVPRQLKLNGPFSWRGTRSHLDHAALLRGVLHAPRLSVAEGKARRKSGATMLSRDGGAVPGAVGRPDQRKGLNLSMIKVGLLSRKGEPESADIKSC